MWFEDEILHPRITRSFLWTLLLQEVYFSSAFLVLKLVAWNPIAGLLGWFQYFLHWKMLAYRIVLCASTVAFGALNLQFYAVEKHVCSTRYEKISKALGPYRLQHFFTSLILGGLVSYCCIGLLHNFDLNKTSLLSSFFILENNLERVFVVLHGCYTGLMFSLKYFICYSYLLKISLEQETKTQHVKRNLGEIAKDSVFCVLKALVWYYLLVIITGPFLQNFTTPQGVNLNTSENLMLSLINYKLFIVTFITGVVVFINWSLYLTVYNAFACERLVCPLEMPIKGDKDKSLSASLVSSESDLLKYLAVLDLRLLSQYDQQRRKIIFSISHPGGHPHHWKAISEICISSLKNLVLKLNEYSLATASKGTQAEINKAMEGSFTYGKELKMCNGSSPELKSVSEKVSLYFREWPTVAYFLDELPSTKIRQLFTSSQPLIWIAETLGFLVSASYTEDAFGVMQQTLPLIICVLLDLKMAEEKLPIDLVGIRMHVKDPQGRYEHLYQRISLKTAVNSSLCRIAEAYKNDINGIYLPDEYQRYFQRYLKKKII